MIPACSNVSSCLISERFSTPLQGSASKALRERKEREEKGGQKCIVGDNVCELHAGFELKSARLTSLANMFAANRKNKSPLSPFCLMTLHVSHLE